MSPSTRPTQDLARWLERVVSRPLRGPSQGTPPEAPQTRIDPRERWIAQWQSLTRPFDTRAPRERVLLGLAAIALVVQVFDTAYLGPAWRDRHEALKALQASQTTVDALSGSVATVAARADTEHRLALAELQRLRTLYGSGAEGSADGTQPPVGSLVAARDMLPLLEQLLERHGGVKIVSFQSLGQTPLGRATAGPAPSPATATTTTTDQAASSPLAASGATPATATHGSTQSASTQPIYRHGVELTLEGSYAELVAYLQAVEALPQRLLWGSLRLKVDEHPRVTMTLRLYTLSLDHRWAEI